jgi:hypothetical protein
VHEAVLPFFNIYGSLRVPEIVDCATQSAKTDVLSAWVNPLPQFPRWEDKNLLTAMRFASRGELQLLIFVVLGQPRL